jgi:hypothetical protein
MSSVNRRFVLFEVGRANVLWIAARRVRLLPDGGSLEAAALKPIAETLGDAITNARTNISEMSRDEHARRLWWEVYERLAEERNGMYGSVTSRAEAQVTRLGCVYAVLDQTIRVTDRVAEAFPLRCPRQFRFRSEGSSLQRARRREDRLGRPRSRPAAYVVIASVVARTSLRVPVRSEWA